MKNLQQQISEKIEQATDILKKFGMPSAQLNDRTAYCLLALLNVTPEKSWENIENHMIGITPMMDFTKTNYLKEYAPNSRETFRRFSVHQLVQAGIVLYNPDDFSWKTQRAHKRYYRTTCAKISSEQHFGLYRRHWRKVGLLRPRDCRKFTVQCS